MKIKESEIRETIQSTIQETFQNLKEAKDYQDFFMKTMDKAEDILDKEINGVDDMTEEERAAFFNYIDTKWDPEEGSVRDDADVSLKDMLGEQYIRSRVREAIKSYVS